MYVDIVSERKYIVKKYYVFIITANHKYHDLSKIFLLFNIIWLFKHLNNSRFSSIDPS